MSNQTIIYYPFLPYRRSSKNSCLQWLPFLLYIYSRFSGCVFSIFTVKVKEFRLKKMIQSTDYLVYIQQWWKLPLCLMSCHVNWFFRNVDNDMQNWPVFTCLPWQRSVKINVKQTKTKCSKHPESSFIGFLWTCSCKWIFSFFIRVSLCFTFL